MRALRRFLVAFSVVASILHFTSAVTAQSSGGRFGSSSGFGSGSSGPSSSFGGGSPSSSSSSGSGGSSFASGSSTPSSGTPSSGMPSGSFGSGSDSGSGIDEGVLYVMALASLVFALIVWLAPRVLRALRAPPPLDEAPERTAGNRSCEVRRISIAFDWTARASIQSALDAAAGQYNSQSAAARWRSATAVRDLLVRSLDSARYAAFQSHLLPPDDAESKFASICVDLNRRYSEATVSNARRTPLSQEVHARREEGGGYVVVSFVVGTTINLPGLAPWPMPQTVRHGLMNSVPANADELVALEVIWSPSVDADRLSSAELEVLYPELIQLGASAGLGRSICKHCRCVFALELGRCPACGSDESAPAPGNKAGAAVSSRTTLPCPYCNKPMPAYEVQCLSCGARAAS